ncbi:hypothetical protein SUGI_0734570 [Cryptomeria japonica]|nr:hypothetical protein SUGI_0734570 [Cryptomeria japonica]
MAETETVQSPMQENCKAGPSNQELSVSVPCKKLAFGVEAIRHGAVRPTWTPISFTIVSEDIEDREAFLTEHSQSIRGVVCGRNDEINAELIDSLPCLEIVATSSVEVDKVDLAKCRQHNIAVVYSRDVLTDEVADLAIALMPDTVRHISASDHYVHQGLWQSKGDYKLTCKAIFYRYDVVLDATDDVSEFPRQWGLKG